MTIINHFISGAETAGSGTGTKPVYNPATGAVTAELRLANRDDLDTTELPRSSRTVGPLKMGVY
jgi:malonate-semialdehyde dehydrogenase (acetylating)/methylmalonate-semialdehyde dehydrogenase